MSKVGGIQQAVCKTAPERGVVQFYTHGPCIGNPYGQCDNPVSYVRHTQFSGSHPLCEYHAKEDPDFMDNTQLSWEKVTSEVLRR